MKDVNEAFREQLLAMKRELEGLEDAFADAGKTVELDQSRVGRLSRMDAMQSQQMALEAGRRRRQQLLAVEAALCRIEAGEFGTCAVCDEEIDVRRLQVDPTNTKCIDCANQD